MVALAAAAAVGAVVVAAGASMSDYPMRWTWSVLVFLFAAVVTTAAQGATSTPQKTFASPDDAASALVQAVKARDRAATFAVLGDVADWISSGDAVADRALADDFVTDYETKHAIVGEGDDKATLTIGNDGFPFAFPLVKSGDAWRFDTAAGKEELLDRRIGGNELDAIKVLQAIADAEHDYASEPRKGDGVVQYTTKFASSPGKRDGLYWPTKAGDPPSPLGRLVADAAGEGYKKGEKSSTPYRGYFYRMLKGQGKNAESGAFDYVVRGREIAGFAVVAYPARYGNSGIMTFIINQDGKVYQSDLGPNTSEKASRMQRFDPGPGWTPVP